MLHDKRIVSAQQAADRLKVDKSTVTRWAKSEYLKPLGRAGDSTLSQLVFLEADVERLAAIRAGEIGDVLDRIDVQAASAEPCEDRNAYVRAAWLNAVQVVSDWTPDRTFHTGLLRAHLPEDARSHACGPFISGLVRRRLIEHTGDYGTLCDPRARHSETPCKVYRVLGVLS